MPPGYLPVVITVEAAVLHRPANWLVKVANKPIHHRYAGDHREVALGDAEGHVDAARISPTGNDMSAAKKEPVRAPARLSGPEQLIERWRLEEPRLEVGSDVHRPWRLAPAHSGDDRLEPRR